MSQNRSSAVMQQRHEAHDSLDDFPTPPWATRALLENLRDLFDFRFGHMTCREPAANRGHMARPLREYFAAVEAADVHDYGAGFPVADYLFGPNPQDVDWTITNPPFRLAEQFIERALATSQVGAAMLVRSAFLEGVGRFERVFQRHRPSWVFQFSERVVMHRGRLAPEGSTATSYCWVVWANRSGPMVNPYAELRWIAPCRKRLEREGDYPVEAPSLEMVAF